MKEIEKQITSTVIRWVAKDGSEFNNQRECENYEETALCAIRAIYKTYVVGVTNTFALFGSDDSYAVEILDVKDNDAVKAILQMIKYNTNNSLEYNAEIIMNSIGKEILIEWGRRDDSCCIYTVDSIKSTIDKAIEAAKKRKNENE